MTVIHASWKRLVISGLVVLSATTTAVRAQQPTDKAQDNRVDQAIYKTINLGVQLYNNGDHYGCYRLYEGQAIALIASTSAHPGLPGIVEAGLAKANTEPSWALRATSLRATLDEVRGALSGQSAPSAKPLWDRLGGEPAVKAVIHDFVLLAAGDPKVDFTRGGKYQIDAAGVANLEKLLVELVSAVTGGPLKYTGRDMKSSHAGMGITNAQFDAIAGDLIAVLNKYKVPQKEQDELIKIIASTRKDIVEATSAPAPPTMKTKSLYERLGGEAAITAVVDDFVARAATDPKVNFTRKGTAAEWAATPENVAHLKKMLIQLLTVTTGGPGKYEGRSMKDSHKGMGITKEEFGAIAVDLKATLDKFKVPTKEQEEVFKIVGSTAPDIIEAP